MMQWQLKAVVAALAMAACAGASARGVAAAASDADRVAPPGTVATSPDLVRDAHGNLIPRDCAAMTGDAQVQCIQEQQSRPAFGTDRTMREGMTRGGGTWS